MTNKITKIRNIVLVGTSFLLYPFIALQNVYAQSDPIADISGIIKKRITYLFLVD